MKALVLKQPWATLVASGIVDVLQFNKNTDYRGRVLLYAKRTTLKDKDYADMPIEWLDTINNHFDFGNLETMGITSAFIGIADLVDVTTDTSSSVWAKGNQGAFKWVFANAKLFDTPHLVNIRTNSLVIDTVELDENNLPPSHTAIIKYPYYEGKELVIPVGDDYDCRIRLLPDLQERFWELCFYDEHLQSLLMGESKRKKQSFCKSLRLVSPRRTVRFKVEDSAIGDVGDENDNAFMHPSVNCKKEIQEQVFVFKLGEMIDEVPPTVDARVLLKCSVDYIFEDGITNVLYGLGTPRGRQLKLIKATEGGLGDRSYIALTWYNGKGVCTDVDDKFWDYITIDHFDGIWHAFLLRYYWHYLPLWWHANYDRRDYVYSSKDLEKVIAQERLGNPIENFYAKQFDVTPHITYKGNNKYIVSACYWSDFGGLIRQEVPVELVDYTGQGFYDRVKFGKEKQKVLFAYECGICY